MTARTANPRASKNATLNYTICAVALLLGAGATILAMLVW